MQIKRAPDQTLIAFACHVELLRGVDIARAASGDDRSSFIRKAVYAELVSRKQPVDEAWINRPDRAKKARYPAMPPSYSASSGKPSSGSTSGGRAGAVSPGAGSAPKRKAAAPSAKTSAPASRARGR